MIIRSLAASLTAAFVAAPALAATPVDVYRLSPVVENGKVTALSVTITLPADADGETRLKVPDEWAGGKDLGRFIKDPVVTGGTLSIPDPKTWVVQSKPGARLTVRYRVVSAYEGRPKPKPNYSHPTVGPDGFYVVGHTIFPKLEGRGDDLARFVWAPKGSGLKLATDLGPLRKKPGKLSEIRSSIQLAGKDLRVLTRRVAGAPLRVAIRGTFDFTDEDFADMAARAVGAGHAFWGEKAEPYLITLHDLDAEERQNLKRGTELGDAFATVATHNAALDGFGVFLTHEYFHHWNPGRVGGLADGPAQVAGYWFSEGFTEFYARRLALRSGLIDLEGFVADWNKALEVYSFSPVRTAPNADIVARFWSSPEVQDLPYQRGALFAAWLQQRLKEKGGLDPVMLAMRDRTDGQKDSAAWGGSAASLLPGILQTRTGTDLTPEIERHIVRGEGIVLPSETFGGCLSIETSTRAAYDAGFDLSETRRTRIVTGVAPDGPAYAAGIRNGMEYLGRERGEYGDSSKEAGFAVRESGPVRVIRYMPTGTITLQRIVMPKDLTPEARAACVKAVAG